jgi:mannose-6-phosphate isomerase-like protein (cupin superfamily)
MHIKKSQAKKIENSKKCTIWEYEFPSKDFSFATALINGRYPDDKYTCNLECQETYYVISGSGRVNSDKGSFKISQGDVYFFEKGEKFG